MRTRSLVASLVAAGAAGAASLAGPAAAVAQEAPAPPAAAAPAPNLPPVSEETIAYFKTNCFNCHLIGGGPATGPDLKDATKRRTREQLTKFILDPKGSIDGGDPYLVKLWNEAKGVYMPQPSGITPDRIAKLLDLIEAESALPESKFAKSGVSDRELTPFDVERGEKIFHGTLALKNGGPSCISCHAVEGVGGFGGGRLGPDLTDAFGRLGGRKALAGWLLSPPSKTMQPVFAGNEMDEAEILGLVAYLQDRAVKSGGRVASGAGIFEFLAAGVGGLVAVLAVFDFLWRGRFKGVRRAMVERSRYAVATHGGLNGGGHDGPHGGARVAEGR